MDIMVVLHWVVLVLHVVSHSGSGKLSGGGGSVVSKELKFLPQPRLHLVLVVGT